MADLPASLITPRTDTTTKPSPAQIRLVIDSMISKVLQGALGLTVHTEKDSTGITIRIDY